LPAFSLPLFFPERSFFLLFFHVDPGCRGNPSFFVFLSFSNHGLADKVPFPFPPLPSFHKCAPFGKTPPLFPQWNRQPGPKISWPPNFQGNMSPKRSPFFLSSSLNPVPHHFSLFDSGDFFPFLFSSPAPVNLFFAPHRRGAIHRFNAFFLPMAREVGRICFCS